MNNRSLLFRNGYTHHRLFEAVCLRVLALLVFTAGVLHAEPVVLQNLAYRLEVSRDEIIVFRLDAPGLARKISPELTLLYSAVDPRY